MQTGRRGSGWKHGPPGMPSTSGHLRWQGTRAGKRPCERPEEPAAGRGSKLPPLTGASSFGDSCAAGRGGSTSRRDDASQGPGPGSLSISGGRGRIPAGQGPGPPANRAIVTLRDGGGGGTRSCHRSESTPRDLGRFMDGPRCGGRDDPSTVGGAARPRGGRAPGGPPCKIRFAAGPRGPTRPAFERPLHRFPWSQRRKKKKEENGPGRTGQRFGGVAREAREKIARRRTPARTLWAATPQRVTISRGRPSSGSAPTDLGIERRKPSHAAHRCPGGGRDFRRN